MRLWVMLSCVINIQGYWDSMYKDTIEAELVVLQTVTQREYLSIVRSKWRLKVRDKTHWYLIQNLIRLTAPYYINLLKQLL